MEALKVGLVLANDVLNMGIRAYIKKNLPYITPLTFKKLSNFEAHLNENTIDILFWDDAELPQPETLKKLEYLTPNTAVVIVSDRLNVAYIQQVLQHGGRGFIYRSGLLDESVRDAITCINRGTIYVSPKAAERMYMGTLVFQGISDREKQVLQLMAEGEIVKAIASKLNISLKTVYRSRDRLREALNVQTTEQIVDEARRQGLL